MPCRYLQTTLIAFALPMMLLAAGCASTGAAVGYSRSELQLIPGKSLERMANRHAADELVAVKVEGRSDPVEVRSFTDKDHVTVVASEGLDQQVRFSDVTDLLIFKRPRKDEQQAAPNRATASGAAGAIGEALVYAPLVPLAVATWPALNVMGLNASTNSADDERARRIYEGLSKQELIDSIGRPKERYACIKKNPRDKDDAAEEIWVYDDDRVLRGGRTLIISNQSGLVTYNSFHTTFFKDPNWRDCKPMALDSP